MQHNLIDKQLIDSTMAQCGANNLDNASIRDIVKIANLLEKATGEKFIRMEMGVPGLPPSQIGTKAEIEALKQGVAQFYPMLEGLPALSQEASRFVKNFMDIDINPGSIIPTVGSMQASYTAFMAVTECKKGQDTMLFIDPGFPVQKTQMEVIGKPYITFDIYEYRGKKLETKLREYLNKGNIAGIIYSNPNNPSWVCLTEEEICKKQNIFTTIFQIRHVKSELIQSVEKIFTKLSTRNCAGKVFIGRTDQSDIHFNLMRGSHRTNATFLNCTQKLHLNIIT